MSTDVGIAGSMDKVVGAKLTRDEISQINMLVWAGLHLDPSDFIREAVREKLAVGDDSRPQMSVLITNVT